MKYIIYIILLFVLVMEMTGTPLSGVISKNMTLKKTDSPFEITSDLVISKNSNVTIEKGVRLVINPSINITVLGSLTALGSESENITFTSSSSQNWGSIIFYAASDQDTSRLEHVSFQNGGSAYHPPLMLKTEIVPIVSNINFTNCSFDGMELAPFDFVNMKLDNTEIKHLILNDYIIPSASVLKIEQGVEIAIANNIDIVCKGSIIASGSFSKPITFTKLDVANWGGISIESALLEQSVFSFCNLSYFGNSQYSSYGGITIVKGSASIEYSSFHDFNRYAVIIKKDGLADIGSGFAGSKGYNIFGEPKTNGSIIVSNYSASNISARYNCWGTNLSTEIDKKIFDQKDNATVGIVDYSNYLDDCTISAPDTPVLEFPLNYSSDMPTNLKCSWFNVQSSDIYHFQISDDSTFSNIVSFKDNLVDTFAFARNLKNGKRYFWRAKSVNFAGESNWSNHYSFKTFDTTKPEPPQIIYPKNGGTNIPTLTSVSWTKIENADNYILAYSKYSDFSNPEYDTTTNNSKEVSLKFDTKYYIKVKSGNSNGWSAWSLENSFTTAPLFSFEKINLPISDAPIQIVPCSINKDALQDMAVRTANKFYLLLRNSNGFAVGFQADISDSDFDFADYDSDGDLDFVYISTSKKATLVNNQPVAFEQIETGIEADADFVVFYDFNNDLYQDIIVFEIKQLSNVRLFTNIISGFVPASNILLNSKIDKIYRDDYNNDGLSDLLLLDNAKANIVNITDSKIEEYSSFNFLTKPHKIICRDIDQDSFKDIISIEFDGNISCIYNYSYSNDFQRMSLDKKIGIKDFDLIDLSNNGFYDFIFTYTDSIAIKEYVNNSFFDYYVLTEKNDINYASHIKYDNRNNDFIISSKNEYFVCINNTDRINQVPNPPNQLDFRFTSDNKIELIWKGATDLESFALGYEIFVSNQTDTITFAASNYDAYYSKSNKFTLDNIKSGSYKWRVKTHDNTFLYSQLSEESSFITPDLVLLPPSSWNFEKQTGEHSLLVIEPNYIQDNFKLNSSMFIGVFYVNDTSLSCAGFAKYNPDKSIAIPIWGDNYITSMIKEGFNQNELIRFKVWDGIKGQEDFVIVEFENQDNVFFPDKIYQGETVNQPAELHIVGKKNQVQFVSTNIELCDPFVYNLPVQSLFHADGTNTNKSSLLNPLEPFIYFSKNAEFNTLFGQNLNPLNYKIHINSGWNLIPYLKEDTSSVESAFDFYSDKIICVISDEGKAWIPQFGVHTLNYLTPGKAYLVNSFDKFDLYYNSTIDKNYSQTDLVTNIKYLPEFTHTGNFMTLLIECPNASELSEVAILENNSVVGSGVFQNGFAIVTVWGDNIFTVETDGATEDANLKLEIFDSEAQENKTILLTGILDILNSENVMTDLLYSKNHILKVNLIYDDTSVKDNDKDSHVYTITEGKIHSNLPIDNFTVYNVLGQVIDSQHTTLESYIDLSKYQQYISFIVFEIEGTTYKEKIIINKY